MYLDSAIIIKLLVKESDSDFFQDALESQWLSSSELAMTEVRSALLSKSRAGTISSEENLKAWRVFNKKISDGNLSIHPLDSEVLQKATQILERCHPDVALRTLDAIHVADCELSRDFPLCTTDKRMRDAAKILRIPLFPE